MPGRIGGHELDVGLQKVVAAVAAVARDNGTHEHTGTVGIEGVVARLHPMVIVPIGLTPQVLPAFEDNRADDLR